MARLTPRPHPTMAPTLAPILRHCPCCGNTMWAAYHNDRTITTLTAVLRLTRKIRRCITPACPQFQHPYRPEAEGHLALPKHECGLDVIALVGALRYAHHRRLPEMPQELRGRQMMIAPRTVPHLLDRYDELVALSLADPLRLQQITHAQGRVILALDGVQLDVGHAGLWVLRDGLSAEVLLARSLLSATPDDRADLLDSVRQALGVPMVGVISDGQSSLRGAVAKALPDVPHQLCHVHSLREAAKSVYEADRPAKKALKKRVRGVRPMARQLEKRTAPEAAVMRGYGSAVRRARTDDGYPPLAAAGLTRHDRLTATSQRLERVGKRGGLLKPLVRLHTRLQRGWTEPAPLWPEVHVAYRGVHRAAHILTNEDQQPGTTGQHRLSGLLGAMMRHCTAAGLLVPALGNFLKVTRSDWPGLFHCDEIPDLPRTNNDLEQRCGAHRSHERRATGRKSASPALVRRGAVQLIAAMATRLRVFAAWELAPEAARAWQSLRHDLDTRRHRRTLQRRFRHNPASYLAELEAALLKLSLPP